MSQSQTVFSDEPEPDEYEVYWGEPIEDEEYEVYLGEPDEDGI